MKILVDTSLSPRIARVLDAVWSPTHTVVHTTDISGKSNSDAEVCDFLLANAPALFLAQDMETLSQPHRMAALSNLKCHMVFLAAGWLEIPPDEQVWKILQVCPRILKRVQQSATPVTLLVTAGRNPHLRTCS